MRGAAPQTRQSLAPRRRSRAPRRHAPIVAPTSQRSPRTQMKQSTPIGIAIARWRPAYPVSSDFLQRKWPLLLPALILYVLCEGCSCEAAELSAASTIIVSLPPTDRCSSGRLAHCFHTSRRCAARRPAKRRMMGGHAAVLRRAAGSITVLDPVLLRARQMACACPARSRVHGQGHGRSSRKGARQACGPLPHVVRVGSEHVSGLSGTACKHARRCAAVGSHVLCLRP
mmetsp:Transcript_62321/g.165407  ORF Transcript_62321/g.165407 Transcript_62321/m.165407 type:complete len:228 (+) Transcript_62321:1934-2617(+)